MSEQNETTTTATAALQEAWGTLLRIVGSIAGAASLTFGIGFVLVNLSLLKYGVFEGALVRERYVAAGISYILLLSSAIVIALTAYSLAGQLTRIKRFSLRLLITLLQTAGMNYVLAVAIWGIREPRAFSINLLAWTLISGSLGLTFLYADPISWIRKLYLLHEEIPLFSSSAASQPEIQEKDIPAETVSKPQDAMLRFRERARSASGLTTLGILFFILLVTYASYVYDTVPAALGGGLPVVVQFTGDGDKMALLAEMGVPLESPITSGQLEFIGQTDKRYFIFVRQIGWEKSRRTGKIRVISRRTALAFDKDLVRGIRYYPSEYHLSADFAAANHLQQGNELFSQAFYDGAIDEYSKALQRQPDSHFTLFKRGQAYLSKASEAPDEGERVRSASQAADDLSTAVGLYDTDPAYWYYLAQAQTLTGQYNTALESLAKAVERDPLYRDKAQVEPLFKALQVRRDLDFGFEVLVFGDVAEAAREYGTQGQENHTTAQSAGDEQVRRTALDQAALAYSRAVSLTLGADVPLEQAKYRASLAQVYLDQGRPDLALTQLEQAVRAAPDNEDYRMQLALVYTEQGRLAEAADQYAAVLERNDKNVIAWLNQGEVLLKSGDPHQAADAFQRASALAPEQADAWYGLGVAHLAFAPDQAEEPFRRTVTLAPERVADIHEAIQDAGLSVDVQDRLEAVLEAAEAVVQGDVALEAGELPQAVEAYQVAVKADPDNVEYRIKLGDTFMKQGDTGAIEAYAEAATQYRRAIELTSDDASFRFRLAQAYAAQGENANALDAINVAISLASKVAKYYAERANLYVDLGRPGDAITDIEQTITLDPSNHVYHTRLGQIYYDQARYGEAVTVLTQAAELNSTYAPGLYYLGLSHLALNDTDAAQTAFAACVEIEGEFQRRCEDELLALTPPLP